MKTRYRTGAAADAGASAVLRRIVVLCLSVTALSCVGSGERDYSPRSGTEATGGASSSDSTIPESRTEREVAAEEAPAAAPPAAAPIAKADSAKAPAKVARSPALPQASPTTMSSSTTSHNSWRSMGPAFNTIPWT